jgi:polar amino acid transport system substrate-binding protein
MQRDLIMGVLKVTICWLLLMVGATVACADIRFGIAAEPYPPFAWKDATGKWVGWEIDLMKAICEEMQEECRIVEVSWDNIIPALNGHFIDVIWSSMGITLERQRVIDFTDVYYVTPSVMIGTRSGDRDISPAHLKTKIIGVQTGTMHERYLAKYFVSSTVKSYQTQDEVLQDLTAGRVDYVQGDYSALQAFLRTPEGSRCCELKGELPKDVEIFGPGAAGGIRKGDTKLKAKLNAALKAVKKSGLYDKITKAYPDSGILPNRE